MNIQKLQLNATLARILLSLALVLILLVMTAGFYMAYNFMKIQLNKSPACKLMRKLLTKNYKTLDHSRDYEIGRASCRERV